MDDFELTSIVWKTLAQESSPQSADALVRLTGADAAPVRATLAGLRQAGLLEVHDQPRVYTVRRHLDALAWARAVDLGVDINLLERYAEMESKDRRLAMQLAVEGEVERVKEAEAADRRHHRQEQRRDKVKSQLAATELGRLVADAMASLKQRRATAPTDEVTQKALALVEQSVQEGQRVLEALQRSMLKE